MAVKIKLKRLGKIRAPYYRIIVADARTKRDGRAIEEIGKYHPKAEPSFIEVNSDRAQHWLSVGAQPTDPVRKILEITGDWQKFKGLPGTEGTLRTAAPKADRKEIFAAAVKETLGDGTTTTKSRGKSGGKDADSGAEKSAKADKADKDSGSGSGRGGRQAKGKSAEQPAKAAKSGGDAAAKDKGDAAAKDKGGAAAKSGGGAAAKDKGGAAADAAEAAAADASAGSDADATAGGQAAGDEAKAEPAAADAESASGD